MRMPSRVEFNAAHSESDGQQDESGVLDRKSVKVPVNPKRISSYTFAITALGSRRESKRQR